MPCEWRGQMASNNRVSLLAIKGQWLFKIERLLET
jgi:hypothetical protein